MMSVIVGNIILFISFFITKTIWIKKINKNDEIVHSTKNLIQLYSMKRRRWTNIKWLTIYIFYCLNSSTLFSKHDETKFNSFNLFVSNSCTESD